MTIHNTYIYLLVMGIIFTTQCMEQCMEYYIKQEMIDSFTDKIVLDYDGYANNACCIAQTAKIVHSDTRGEDLTDISVLQEKYAHIKNLTFTTPQSKFYDVVTIYNSNILNKKNMIWQLSDTIKEYLKINGEIHALVRTQKHFPSIGEAVFLILYPQVYELLSTEKKGQVKEKWHPLNFDITSKNQFLTDAKMKEDIWLSGYDIISYKEIVYETIMDLAKTKKVIKSDFLKMIEECEFSKEIQKSLYKQFLLLILDKYKRNDIGEVIIPTNATKIHLCNKGPMRLRVNLYVYNNPTDFP